MRYRRTRSFLIHLEEQGNDLLADLMKGEYWLAESAALAERWFLLLLATLRQTFGDHPLVAQLSRSRTQQEAPTNDDLESSLRAQLEILAQSLEQLPDIEVGPGGSVSL